MHYLLNWKGLKFTLKYTQNIAPTCFPHTTIIRELVLNLAKVIFILKHPVELLRYMLFGDVAACHRVECVLCAVQNARYLYL
jgi:hypothetical protein